MRQLPKDFDWKFYLDYHEDLKRAGFKTESEAKNHYLNFGYTENRKYCNLNITYDFKSDGVNLFGFGNYDLGLGHNMRMFVSVLKNVKIPYTTHNIKLSLKSKEYLKEDISYKYNTNLFLINPDSDYNKSVFNHIKNKYNIALWAWELDLLPENWKKVSQYFDEIWTISSFCEDVFKKELPNQVIKSFNIPGDFKEKRNKKKSKIKLGYDDKFICLFVFDSNSDLERKNPLKVIETFKKSISKYSNCLLVLKVHNLNFFQKKDYFDNLPENILLINETWSKDKMTDLFNSADVYISLHRSEGSGLTIMEAIDLEIPVICTNYSGNLDFCDDGCQLVDYDLKYVESSEIPTYDSLKNKAKWADVNIDDSVKKLTEIYENYDLYVESIKSTKEKLNKKFNIDTLSEQIIKSLNYY